MICNWKQSGENGGMVPFVLRKAKTGTAYKQIPVFVTPKGNYEL